MTSNSIKLSDIIAPSFYELHKAIKKDTYFEIWCKGGRGSTKSSFVSIEIMLGLIRDTNANAVIARRYDNELRDSVFTQMEWACNMLSVSDHWRFYTAPMRAVNQQTGQRILFKGADKPEKLKSIKIPHGYIKYFWAEELHQFGGMSEIRSIIQSIFRGSTKKQVSIYSYNPPKSARSWVNEESKKEKDGKCIHHSVYTDVPVDWLGERFIAEAEHLKSTNESAYKHEYLGEEIGTGLEVFNNIEIRNINQDEINSFEQIRQGLDFGYAVDPVCFVRCNYNRKKRELYIFSEISGIGIGNRALYDKLNDIERKHNTIADSAEPKSIDELRSYGMSVIGAVKGAGSVENGIKWLCELEKIVIDPVKSPLCAREFVNYSLEMNRQGDIISRYPDKDNHGIDAIRYAVNNDIIDVSIDRQNIAGRLGL